MSKPKPCRPFTVEQQHHALRLASARELTHAEATALVRSVEAYRDLETLVGAIAGVVNKCDENDSNEARQAVVDVYHLCKTAGPLQERGAR